MPQALLTLRTRQVQGISVGMYSLFTAGVALWLGYGIVPNMLIGALIALVAALQRHAKALFGEEIPVVGTPLYTDVRLYGAAGVPAVIYGAGPRTGMVPVTNHRHPVDDHKGNPDRILVRRRVAGLIGDRRGVEHDEVCD